MTNVFVGFNDQRSCNRILKPPGGGTSDLFFSPERSRNEKKVEKITEIVPQIQEEQTFDVKVESNTTEIDNVNEMKVESTTTTPARETNMQHSETNIEESRMQSLTIDGDGKNESIKVEDSKQTVEIMKVTKNQTESVSSLIQQNDNILESPKKSTVVKSPNRVPPGGYSSGLW